VSKPLAVDELNASIRDGVMNIPCQYTVAELRTFVREANGKMHGSPHDDRVMSLGIANQMLKYVWYPEYQHGTEPRKFSGNWWAKQIAGNKVPKTEPIGAFNVRGNDSGSY
jgi:hypothetical protein